MKGWPILAAIVVAAVPAAASGAEAAPVHYAELADLEIEQLTRITVTSASRREERLVDVPASIYVITGEDVRRSGAQTLLEALRLAPNLIVMRSSANNGSVGTRGGMTGGVNKMLVLVDGRTVYSPLFSGVFWDAQDLMLADIDRIEVVSGPGSTLWGTNAVNGLIRIITKGARATRGVLADASAGNLDRGAEARLGTESAGKGAVRVYGRYLERDARELLSGASARDGEQRWTAGFRGDWGEGGNTTTVQGDAYNVRADSSTTTRDLTGGNLLARWSLESGDGSSLRVQAYWDHYRRDQPGAIDETRDTFDLEVQHAPRFVAGHVAVWGFDLRSSKDKTRPMPTLGFVPDSRTLNTASLFAQDDFRVSQALRATLGLRAEHNPYTGWEWLPTARLAWDLGPDHLAWASLTRTVRAPTRVDREAVSPGLPPFFLIPNDSFESEVADVAELGYRRRLGAGTSLSLTAFRHELKGLRTAQRAGSQIIAFNGADADVNGLEGWIEAIATPDWRLTVGGMLMHESVRDRPGTANGGAPPYGNNPRRTGFLRSLWNVTHDLDLDVLGRYTSELPNPAVPSRATLDVRLGWNVTRTLSVSLAVENLFDRHSVEYAPSSAVMERNWLLKLTYVP